LDSPSESDSSDGSPEENEQNKKPGGKRANEKKRRGHRTDCKKKLFIRDRLDRLVFVCNSHRQLPFKMYTCWAFNELQKVQKFKAAQI